MNTASTYPVTEETYHNCIAWLESNGKARSTYRLRPFTSLDEIPDNPPAETYECTVGRNGFHFSINGRSSIWSIGDPSIIFSGTAFELDPESARIINSLCRIMTHPTMHAGISEIRHLMIFFRGVAAAIPENGGYAFQTPIDDAWHALLSQPNASEINKLPQLIASCPERSRQDAVRTWRAAFRDSILFKHPEIGLSYTAYMGSSNLFCFQNLINEKWLW